MTVSTNTMYQSNKMREVQDKFGEPLPKLLRDLQNQHGAKVTCEILGISHSSLGYWNLKCGVRVVRVAYIPGKEKISVDDGVGRVNQVAE